MKSQTHPLPLQTVFLSGFRQFVEGRNFVTRECLKKQAHWDTLTENLLSEFAVYTETLNVKTKTWLLENLPAPSKALLEAYENYLALLLTHLTEASEAFIHFLKKTPPTTFETVIATWFDCAQRHYDALLQKPEYHQAYGVFLNECLKHARK